MAEFQRIVVLVTAPREKSEMIAETMVKEKLAACANIVEKVASIYWWKGKIEKDEEALIIFKTELGVFSRFVKKMREIHPYETPEIIALPIVAGNPDYLVWIAESLGRGED